MRINISPVKSVNETNPPASSIKEKNCEETSSQTHWKSFQSIISRIVSRKNDSIKNNENLDHVSPSESSKNSSEPSISLGEGKSNKDSDYSTELKGFNL